MVVTSKILAISRSLIFKAVKCMVEGRNTVRPCATICYQIVAKAGFNCSTQRAADTTFVEAGPTFFPVTKDFVRLGYYEILKLDVFQGAGTWSFKSEG